MSELPVQANLLARHEDLRRDQSYYQLKLSQAENSIRTVEKELAQLSRELQS